MSKTGNYFCVGYASRFMGSPGGLIDKNGKVSCWMAGREEAFPQGQPVIVSR